MRANRGKLKQSGAVRWVAKNVPRLKDKLKWAIAPETLFTGMRHGDRLRPEIIFLTTSHDKPEIVLDPCTGDDAARRVLQANLFEQSPLFQLYRAYRFAFPDRTNEFLEAVGEIQAAGLAKALANQEIYQVFHPYPVPLESLFERLRPCFEGAS